MAQDLPDYESDLFQEERDKRRHLEAMAEIARRDRSTRRDEHQPLWLGGAVVVVLLALIGAIWTGVDRQHASDRRMEEIRQSTAQRCIDTGDIWISGNCVPAVKR